MRRSETYHLFPETFAERKRRKAKTNKNIKLNFIQEEEESYPFEFQLRPLVKTIKNININIKKMKNNLYNNIIKTKYITKAERKKMKIHMEYERTEHELKKLQHKQKISDSQRQQSMIQLALLYMSKSKLGGHHCVAQVSCN